jgi:uncharacterized membrane protein YtjA (UPF0391 family)
MFRLAIVFLFVSLITALVGFGVISSSYEEAAKILFPIVLMLALLAFLVGGVRSILSAKL